MAAELFTTVGSLRVVIFQACDVFSAYYGRKLSPKKLQNNFSLQSVATTTRNCQINGQDYNHICAAFATITVCNDNGTVLHKYDTAIQPCYDLPADGQIAIGEEFIFDSIPSTCTISISIYSVAGNAAGTAIISREKENEKEQKTLSKSSYNLFSNPTRGGDLSAIERVLPSSIGTRIVCVGNTIIPVSRLEENKSVIYISNISCSYYDNDAYHISRYLSGIS